VRGVGSEEIKFEGHSFSKVFEYQEIAPTKGEGKE